jgi:fatty acid desaturase
MITPYQTNRVIYYKSNGEKIIVKSAEERQNCVKGAQDANERLEAQQSRKFSMCVIALLTVLSCLLGLFLLLKFILVAIGCYYWWSMLLLWFAVSAVFTGCMIIPRLIADRKRSKKDA